jgi:preprotein translocase subunit SecG
MTGRGAGNALTRTTAILGALFFATSLGLTLMAGNRTATPTSIFGEGQSGGGGGALPGLVLPSAPATPPAQPAPAPAAPQVPQSK